MQREILIKGAQTILCLVELDDHNSKKMPQKRMAAWLT